MKLSMITYEVGYGGMPTRQLFYLRTERKRANCIVI